MYKNKELFITPPIQDKFPQVTSVKEAHVTELSNLRLTICTEHRINL